MHTEAKTKANPGAIQEFTDQAITDPAELDAIARRLRRPKRPPVAWMLLAAAVIALLAGLLLGRFILP